MFNYYEYNSNPIYTRRYDWEVMCFCKSEKVRLEDYLNNSKKDDEK